MQNLVNLNEPKIPRYRYSQDSSTSTELTGGTTLRSPLMFNMSEHTECLRLTPVNIKNLTSPLKTVDDGAGCISDESAPCTGYKESFNLISRKLEKILGDLNVIYREIGYSNDEISAKEKLIFNNLSDSITGFFEHANEEKERIMSDNQNWEQVLQRVLQILRDPRGTSTIPDLYTRNVLLSNDSQSGRQQPGSPKKPISLLTKKKILSKARSYVLKTYRPQLVDYLQGSIRLRSLHEAIDDFRPEYEGLNIEYLLSTVPPVEMSKYFLSFFDATHDNNVAKLCEFITENKKSLLHTVNFDDISKDVVQHIQTLSCLYEKEYSARARKLQSLCSELLDIISVLGRDAQDELDPQIVNTLRVYSQLKEPYSQPYDCSTKTLARLGKLFKDLKAVEEARKREKAKLEQTCSELWEKLKIPSSYVQKFRSENAFLSASILQAYRDEFQRLQGMKKKLIKSLIQDSRNKIQELWSAMHLCEKDTYGFKELFDTMVSQSTSLEDDEKVLEACETEIKDLERRLALYKPILTLIDEFKSLQEDKLALEKSSKDSSRLLSRNSHKILLQEEKTRKRITRHFPNVTQELIVRLSDFESDFGEPFLLDGAKFLDIALKQEQELLSKYPRSRVNSSFRHPKSKPPSTRLSPIRLIESDKNSKNYRRGPRNVLDSGLKSRPGKPYPSTLHNSSPIRGPEWSACKPLRWNEKPPTLSRAFTAETIVQNSSPSRIPKFSRDNFFNATPILKLQDGSASTKSRPAGLALMSSNKLNSNDFSNQQRSVQQMSLESGTPFSRAAVSPSGASEMNKENLEGLPLKSPVKLLAKRHSQDQIWTFKEKHNETPLTQLTESNTKSFSSLDHKRDNLSELDDDDTSIMDDGKFANWKREKLANLNNERGAKNPGSSINWETDVF
ncbi:LAMI_0E12442g1_1 [Lachancea mirantina]|uniref:LAMI_0E12442g1_1 n=1 Tax=Lachancea mirantina TaxID=1230905 RepID=A0A1G4JQ49_9SACH|nr:LAMI_0E12442g1_1 [Lachancea mirantina]